jgi:hypothetical protein
MRQSLWLPSWMDEKPRLTVTLRVELEPVIAVTVPVIH